VCEKSCAPDTDLKDRCDEEENALLIEAGLRVCLIADRQRSTPKKLSPWSVAGEPNWPNSYNPIIAFLRAWHGILGLVTLGEFSSKPRSRDLVQGST